MRVAKVFSEVLGVPYLIDPNVMGTVTVRSGGKILDVHGFRPKVRTNERSGFMKFGANRMRSSAL